MGEPLTRVQPVESSVESPAAPPPYRLLRHLKHSHRRKLILGILTADPQTSPSRRLRYADCGRGGFVWWDPDERRVQLTCYRCRDLFCPTCAHERRRQVSERLTSFFANFDLEHSLKLATFTLRSSDEPLADQLSGLIAAFRRLRQRQWWRRRVNGGCWFIQVTRNKTTGLWHPHLHCLMDSQYLVHDELIGLWEKCSGGSTVVDVRVIQRRQHAARYVSRYVAQPVEISKLPRPAIAETIRAFHARRLWHPFGDWTRELAKVEDPPSTARWEPIGQVDRIIRLATQGHVVAENICKQLRLDFTWRPPDT